MPDQQAGHEKTLTYLLPALAGCNLIYGMGMLELGMTFSFEQLVIDNEMAAIVKRVVKGIKVTDETLAVELIKKVGSGQDFLAQKHTREYMRAEQSRVKLIDRRMRGAWQKRGGKDVVETAREEVQSILINHKPVSLESEVAAKLRAIVTETEAEVADETS